MPTCEPIHFHPPTAADGFSVNTLVANSPPLDTNSVYCNILQCSHFAETSVSAKQEDELVGFMSAYLIPARPHTLFIWQVVVAERLRSQGVASRMLQELLKRPACRNVRYLETTITESNESSWLLFKRFAGRLGAQTRVTVAFDKDEHFNGRHETEKLLIIGPLPTPEREDAS